MVHGNERPIEVTLPEIEGVTAFVSLWSSADEAPRESHRRVPSGRGGRRSPAPRCICSARSDGGAIRRAADCRARRARGRFENVVTSTRTARSRPWRSASSDPASERASGRRSPHRDDRDAAASRSHCRSPSVPGRLFRPKAFAGEVVPFRTTAFREGHDLIGVHVRLFSPSGDESLHRPAAAARWVRPVGDAVAPLEAGRVALSLRGVRR